MVSLNQFLTLYMWFPLAGLLFFALLIARFYEKFSGQKTYFRLLLLPIVVFGIWSVRTASNPDDVIGALLSVVAGLPLIVISMRLARLMLRHGNQEKKD